MVHEEVPGSLALTSTELDFLESELKQCVHTKAEAQDPVKAPSDSSHGQAPPECHIPPTNTSAAPSAPLSRHNSDNSLSSAVAARKSSGPARQRPGSGNATVHAPLSLLKQVEQLEAQLTQALSGDAPSASSGGLSLLAKELCKQYNLVAMQLLDLGQAAECLRLLEKAQVMCDADGLMGPDLITQFTTRSAILNNLACYHKRVGAPWTAFKLLQQAMQFDKQLLSQHDGQTRAKSCPQGTKQDSAGAAHTSTGCSVPEGHASTLLNLCTVLSALGKHDEAVLVIQQAILLLCSLFGMQPGDIVLWATSNRSQERSQDQAAGAKERRSTAAQGCDEGSKACDRDELDSRMQSRINAVQHMEHVIKHMPSASVSVLVLSLYNLAVELEHLKQQQAAHHWYHAAAGMACKSFGRGSTVAQLLTKSLQAFQCKLRRLGSRPSTAQSARPVSATSSRWSTAGQLSPRCTSAQSTRSAGPRTARQHGSDSGTAVGYQAARSHLAHLLDSSSWRVDTSLHLSVLLDSVHASEEQKRCFSARPSCGYSPRQADTDSKRQRDHTQLPAANQLLYNCPPEQLSQKGAVAGPVPKGIDTMRFQACPVIPEEHSYY